ncbi:cyanophycin synthetase, partial [Arthrospira platensis SPKY1]|nr:cyanophycin synthetase [Arthrospira platensis SPKY1]
MQALSLPVANDAFANFAGITRRQRILHQDNNTIVLEDYAHHPSEIRVLLDALSDNYADYQLQLIFQPHRFSRTACLAQEFARVLSGLDSLWLMPVYAAHENFRENGTSEAIAKSLSGKATLLNAEPAALAKLKKAGKDSHKTLYAFVGAGDIG